MVLIARRGERSCIHPRIDRLADSHPVLTFRLRRRREIIDQVDTPANPTQPPPMDDSIQRGRLPA
jgi:hypothetical protein